MAEAGSGAAPGKWGDLVPRLLSAIVLAAVGLGEVWIGGWSFDLLVVLIAGLVGWEVARMLAPASGARPIAAGAAVAVALFLAVWLDSGLGVLGMALLAAGAFRVLLGAGGDWRGLVFPGAFVLAGFGLVALREAGLGLTLFFIFAIVATDVAGYFAGRILGGPKFWPRVSPKKTWSGTVAGWLAALAVAAAFAPSLGAWVLWIAVPLSFASQMGDAAESALKRSVGVKDSSQLIPGHGGVYDRFDAMMGAGLLVGLYALAGGL